MKRVSVIGACLAALLAIGAMAAPMASAVEGPEFIPSKGFPTRFTSKGGLTVFEFANGKRIKCEKVGGLGEFTNAHRYTVTLSFEKCTTTIAGVSVPCGNQPGAASGVIKMENVPGEIGYIENNQTLVSSTKVASLLLKETGTLASFKCGALGTELKGVIEKGVIAEIPAADLNKAGLKEILLKFTQTGGKQTLITYLLSLANGSTPAMSWLNGTRSFGEIETLTGREELGWESLEEINIEAGTTVEIKS